MLLLFLTSAASSATAQLAFRFDRTDSELNGSAAVTDNYFSASDVHNVGPAPTQAAVTSGIDESDGIVSVEGTSSGTIALAPDGQSHVSISATHQGSHILDDPNLLEEGLLCEHLFWGYADYELGSDIYDENDTVVPYVEGELLIEWTTGGNAQGYRWGSWDIQWNGNSIVQVTLDTPSGTVTATYPDGTEQWLIDPDDDSVTIPFEVLNAQIDDLLQVDFESELYHMPGQPGTSSDGSDLSWDLDVDVYDLTP